MAPFPLDSSARPRATLRVCLLAACALIPSLASAAPAEGPVLEALQGDRAVVVFSNGTQRFVSAGERLQYWDQIQTSRNAAAKVRFPDGSVLIVGRDTKVAVLPKQGGTQYNQLDWGQVRAQVQKEEAPKDSPKDPKEKAAAAAAAAKAPPRFVIRTKTAVMGVRGTDFLAGFDSASGESSLHTFEGTVDFGRSETQVMGLQGTPVTAGKAASLSADLSAPRVAAFNAPAYEQKIKAAQPELLSLADKPKAKDPEGAEEPREEQDEAARRAALEAEQAKRDEEDSAPKRPRLKILDFRAQGVFVQQQAGGKLMTGGGSWSPSLRLLGSLALRLHVGAHVLKLKSDGGRFFALQFAPTATLNLFGPIRIESGVGIEQWTHKEQGMGGPILLGNIAWTYDDGRLLESIFVGVTQFKRPSNSQLDSTQLRAGIGVHF